MLRGPGDGTKSFDGRDEPGGTVRQQPRHHRNLPETRIGETGAFYGILGGHQDRVIIVEAQIDGGVGVVIGERVLDEIEAAARSIAKNRAG